LRTPSNDFVSEATVATYIRKSIFSIIEMVRFPLMIKKYFVQNELEFGIL